MAPLSTSIEVARPPEEVFAYVTDPTRFAEGQANVVDGHMEGEAPHGVGQRCRTTRRVGFAERTMTSEITHLDAPRTWGVRAIDSPVRATVDVAVEPLDERRTARVRIELDFTGQGIGKLLVPLIVRRQAKNEMPANLQRLKECLEAAK